MALFDNLLNNWGDLATLGALGIGANQIGGQDASAENIDRLTPEQLELLKKQITDTSQLDIQSPVYNQRLDFLNNLISDQSFANKSLDTLQQNLEPWNSQDATQLWKNAYVDPATKNLMETLLPQVEERYAGKGAISSSGFNRTTNKTTQNVIDNLNSQLASLLYQDKSNYENKQLQSISTGSNIESNIANLLAGADADYNTNRDNQLKSALGTEAYNTVTYPATPNLLSQTSGTFGNILEDILTGKSSGGTSTATSVLGKLWDKISGNSSGDVATDVSNVATIADKLGFAKDEVANFFKNTLGLGSVAAVDTIGTAVGGGAGAGGLTSFGMTSDALDAALGGGSAATGGGAGAGGMSAGAAGSIIGAGILAAPVLGPAITSGMRSLGSAWGFGDKTAPSGSEYLTALTGGPETVWTQNAKSQWNSYLANREKGLTNYTPAQMISNWIADSVFGPTQYDYKGIYSDPLIQDLAQRIADGKVSYNQLPTELNKIKMYSSYLWEDPTAH